MSKNLKIIIIFIFLLVATVGISHLVMAQELDVGLEYGEQIGLGSADPRIIIARIIRIALGFLGVLAVGLIMYAGWLYMASEGSAEKIEQAKKVLINAIIGLVIVLSAFAISSFILNRLIGATTGRVADRGGGGSGRGGGLVALGSGIISSHYPAREAKNIPRNTKIVITFKEAMDVGDIIAENKINSANIFIYKTVDGSGGPFITDVTVQKTDDNKTFIFTPAKYLGSPSEEIYYTVALSSKIKKAGKDKAFPGNIGDIGYDWSFMVGTAVDNTPPTITSVIPRPGVTNPRNVVIQINFSEAVNPMAVSGAVSGGFNNIAVSDKDSNAAVNGNFYISNQYKTVEFLTTDKCGVNSCEKDVYCLPGGTSLSVLAKAATLIKAGEPIAIFPYDGAVDMADNSLDGNADGVAQGKEAQSRKPPYNANEPDKENQGDDYIWSFSASDEIDISAPEIIAVSPDIGDIGVSLDAIPEATFNKLLRSSSLNTKNITLASSGQEVNYWISKDDSETQTTVKINHSQFNEDTDYSPQFFSDINDIYQNCYTPCSGLGVIGAPSCCEGAASGGSSCY